MLQKAESWRGYLVDSGTANRDADTSRLNNCIARAFRLFDKVITRAIHSRLFVALRLLFKTVPKDLVKAAERSIEIGTKRLIKFIL